MPPRKNKPELPGQQQLDFSLMPLAMDMMESILPTKTSYTVSEVNALLEGWISEHPVLGGPLVVEGELSNVKRSSRGHVYFTLKDASSAIGGILWASTANRLKFDLKDGLAVYLTGRLEIYQGNGTYSIVGSKIEPVGVGALQLAFEQIKTRLEAEGLFMEEFKQEIPVFPERIGLITSSTGAVIHDMLRVIRRKNPLVSVILAPVKVQGEGAAAEIAAAIQELNHPHYGIDTLIVARGGGSFEDLFCFSEEAVVRAIFESSVPVVTGIGHEPDYSLADAAADYSASTPTAAADWVVPDVQMLATNLSHQAEGLLSAMAGLILECEQTLDYNATRLIDLHQGSLTDLSHHLELKQERLVTQAKQYFDKRQQSLAEAASVLDAYNPLTTLARGYAVATSQQGEVIRSIQQVQAGSGISLKLKDGQLDCTIKSIHPSPPQED